MTARHSTLAAALALSTVLAGCAGTVTPTASPQEMTGVMSALVLRGVTIRQVVSGDAGCPGSGLHSNAARIDLTLVAGGDHSVYLFRWRRRADFDAAAGTFADCAAQHAAESPAAAADVVEVPPWRAYGTGWTRELNAILHEALRAAADDT